MSKGYIKLFRQIQECWIWNTGKFDKRSAWIDLLMLANHSDKKIVFNGEYITIKKGQYLTSIRNLANRWMWSTSSVSSFLKLLEDDLMIKKDSDKYRTLVTIINYKDFQESKYTKDTVSDTPTDTPTDTVTNTVAETNNKLNKLNKDKRKDISKDISKRKVDEYYEDADVNAAFIDYVRMRKLIKHPMTEEAIKRAKAKLEKLSAGNRELAIAILNQSVDHSWQGLFELKDKGVTNAKQHNTTEFTEEELRERGFWDDFV